MYLFNKNLFLLTTCLTLSSSLHALELSDDNIPESLMQTASVAGSSSQPTNQNDDNGGAGPSYAKTPKEDQYSDEYLSNLLKECGVKAESYHKSGLTNREIVQRLRILDSDNDSDYSDDDDLPNRFVAIQGNTNQPTSYGVIDDPAIDSLGLQRGGRKLISPTLEAQINYIASMVSGYGITRDEVYNNVEASSVENYAAIFGIDLSKVKTHPVNTRFDFSDEPHNSVTAAIEADFNRRASKMDFLDTRLDYPDGNNVPKTSSVKQPSKKSPSETQSTIKDLKLAIFKATTFNFDTLNAIIKKHGLDTFIKRAQSLADHLTEQGKPFNFDFKRLDR